MKEEIKYSIHELNNFKFLIAESSKGICALSIEKVEKNLISHLNEQFPNFQLIPVKKCKYTDDALMILNHSKKMHSLPLDIRGTVFQKTVWSALQKIPYGTTRSYSDIADMIGKPKAVRAVANACGANKIAIIIPCHRVISKDGSIGGYYWGSKIKRELLQREGIHIF